MRILFAWVAIFLSPAALAAQSSTPSTGAGITLGSPYGLTGRTWLNDVNSIDYGFGWDLLNSSKFEVYSDYLWNRPDTFEISDQKLDLFYGAGLVLRSHSGANEDSAVFGPRAPVGVSMFFTHPDLEVFAAFALNAALIPHSDVFIDLNVGARFTIF